MQGLARHGHYAIIDLGTAWLGGARRCEALRGKARHGRGSIKVNEVLGHQLPVMATLRH
jgi:hypothetical protein